MRKFETRSLTADLIEQAFPVVQAAAPGVSLDAWRAFADRPTEEASRGIVVAFDEQSYIVGLFVFQVTADLDYGLALVVRHLVAVDLIDPGPVLRTLLDAIEETAVQKRCDAIVLTTRTEYLRTDGSQPHPLFEDRGYWYDVAQMTWRRSGNLPTGPAIGAAR